jgi:dTDP-glucose pyrophosphorylase
MQAILLAAGRATRLLPLSSAIPKCLLPVSWSQADSRYEVVIERLIRQVCRAGAKDVIVVVGNHKDAVMTYLGDGSQYGVNISYTVEAAPQGEAGALYLAKQQLSGTFLVADADNFVEDVDVFRHLLKHHVAAGAVATVGIAKVNDARSYAIVQIGSDGCVKQLVEKPPEQRFWSNLAKTGLYVIDRHVLDADIGLTLATSGEYTTTALFQYLVDRGDCVAAHEISGVYGDIGTWHGYRSILHDASIDTK